MTTPELDAPTWRIVRALPGYGAQVGDVPFEPGELRATRSPDGRDDLQCDRCGKFTSSSWLDQHVGGRHVWCTNDTWRATREAAGLVRIEVDLRVLRACGAAFDGVADIRDRSAAILAYHRDAAYVAPWFAVLWAALGAPHGPQRRPFGLRRIEAAYPRFVPTARRVAADPVAAQLLAAQPGAAAKLLSET